MVRNSPSIKGEGRGSLPAMEAAGGSSDEARAELNGNQ